MRRPHEEFIRRCRKGLPADRALKSVEEFYELCIDIEDLLAEIHRLNAICDACTEVLDEQHQIIIGIGRDAMGLGEE